MARGFDRQIDKPSLKPLGIVFNKAAGRFANSKTGKFLSKVQSINLINTGIDKAEKTLQNYAIRLAAGKINLSVFATGVGQTIKKLHVYHAAIALDGRLDTITKPQLAALNQRVKEQLGSTEGFGGDRYGILELLKDLIDGNVSEAQLKNRLRLYAKAAEQTKALIILESKKSEGKTQAMRHMIGDHATCKECVSYWGMGWVNIADIVMPGEKCSCRANCRCTVEYR